MLFHNRNRMVDISTGFTKTSGFLSKIDKAFFVPIAKVMVIFPRSRFFSLVGNHAFWYSSIVPSEIISSGCPRSCLSPKEHHHRVRNGSNAHWSVATVPDQ